MSGEETAVDQPTGAVPTIDDIKSIVSADGSGLDRVFNLYGKDAVGPQVALSELQRIFSQSGYEGVTAALRGETATTDTATHENETPPPTRPDLQRQRLGLIEAIMAGDKESVNQTLGMWEKLAARFGASGIFAQIKSIIDDIMGSGETPTADDRTRVETATGNLIDQILPPETPAPAPGG